MSVWKLTTLAFACTSVWLGWPEAEPVRRAPMTEAFEAWTDRDEVVVVEDVSSNRDAIAAIRAGEIALAERSLEDPRPRVSRAAVEALFRAGASDVLAAAIHEDAPTWRNERIIAALGWIADDVSVRTLSEVIDDRTLNVQRWRVAEALGTTASPHALPALRRFVEAAQDASTIDRALAAVAYLAIPEGDRLLLAWAQEPGELGWRALSRVDPGLPEAAPVLRAALQSMDFGRVYAATSALAGTTEVLHDELLECAARRDEARGPCLHILALRGEVELVANQLDGRGDLEDVAWGLNTDEHGREVLERLRHSDSFDTRRIALAALAGHSESARAELVTMANEGTGATRIELGVELLNAGASEGVELIVDGLLTNSSFARHRNAYSSLAANEEHGVPALRDLARSADGVIKRNARSQLLARSQLDDADVDILAAALEEGDASILHGLRATRLPPRALRVLEDHLGDPDTRMVAMHILGARVPTREGVRLAGNDPELQAVLLRVSPDDPALDGIVRRLGREHDSVGDVVSRMGDGPAVQRYLHDSLDGRDDRADAFSYVAARLPSDELEGYVRDSDPAIRQQAIRQLANREGPEATRGGLRAIGDADPEVRAIAIDALSASSDPTATRALVDATRDQDDDVAIRAIGAVLYTLGGDAVGDIVDLAFDPYYSQERRAQIALRLLNSEHEIDTATLVELRRITGRDEHPRVIQLEEL